MDMNKKNIRLNEKGLKKIGEARASGFVEMPEWLKKDMENIRADYKIEREGKTFE